MNVAPVSDRKGRKSARAGRVGGESGFQVLGSGKIEMGLSGPENGDFAEMEKGGVSPAPVIRF